MPGPVGTWDQNYEVDDGTSARIASRPPGPTRPRSPSLWERGEALHDAYERALVLAPGAVFKKTGYALGELLKGLLPGLLQTLIVLAASTALGAAVGGVVGFFFGGVGAAPGAVVGGELGLEIGTAVLSWLGLAFLAKAIIQGFGELWGVLCMGVKRAWAAPESSESEYPHQIERAALDLADAVGILMLLILQAIVAWVFTRAAIGSTKGVIQTAASNRLASGEAANASVAALVQELRASRLGSSFADWVEQNWARLRDDPKLRFKARPTSTTGPMTQPPIEELPLERRGASEPKEPPAPPSKPLTSFEDVGEYLRHNGTLPENFVTKDQAKTLGWSPKKGNLGQVAPGKSIGGDPYQDFEGRLPSAPGRTWREADINYAGGVRGPDRLVYSSDGLMFKTTDHYTTFTQVTNP
jgi:hypothetical protein